MFTIEKKPGSL